MITDIELNEIKKLAMNSYYEDQDGLFARLRLAHHFVPIMYKEIERLNEEVKYLKSQKPINCVWCLEDADNGTWETGCGMAFSLITDTVKENEFKFCLYCGKPIEEKQPVKEVE
jgi:hypothetical protein